MSSKETQAPHLSRKRLLGAHPAIALAFLLSIAIISLGDLIEIIPLFAPLVASSFFPFFHEVHDLMAAGLVIFATYKHYTRLGIASIIVYVAVHLPYFVVQFPENATELPRNLFVVFGAIFGIWLIGRLYKSEEGVRQEAKQWQSTFDSISECLTVQGKDFKIVKVNRSYAQLFKMKPEEIIGKSCHVVVHATNEPCQQCPFRQTLTTKKPATEEYFEPHLERYLQVSVSPIFNDRSDVIGCVHLVKDVTERKRDEEQLHLADRLAVIGEMTSGVAHELNNPLTSIIGFSELLSGRDLPDDIKEDLRVINTESHRAAVIVRNLLSFARKREATREPVDINNVIMVTLSLRAYEQRVNNIQAGMQLAADLPQVNANGFQFQQVFMNLIVNAEQAMLEAHNKGTLTITTERVGDIVKARLTDDGPGISPENMRKLFTPFFTTKGVGKGTGLGLSICHRIITEHGGKIYAESEPGKGATFIVELPIKQAETNQEGASKI